MSVEFPQTVPIELRCLGTVTFTYKNWKGEVRERRCVFLSIYYGTTSHHSEPQWLVKADEFVRPFDAPPQRRDFALKDMSNVTYEP